MVVEIQAVVTDSSYSLFKVKNGDWEPLKVEPDILEQYPELEPITLTQKLNKAERIQPDEEINRINQK